ncbi:hypothetical protein CLOAM1758 [Candidatus Cloacimonas acidaminovorans str. Evry]|uniref:Uncharacterized protein n=1 Tax=Cloacimonas acidaminovorans (strain Evry) TaxID=459349 RepID=B0VJD9_CLOAI|nr:hypothetical protein CLOAM1758 [Candidatus Cloacimonas acidaminovorans str. Evry]
MTKKPRNYIWAKDFWKALLSNDYERNGTISVLKTKTGAGT